MGNVPIVRMDPHSDNRVDIMIGRLLDEVLKDFLWRCRVALAATAGSPLVFLPRPPELISLVGLQIQKDGPDPTIVYPDPPLTAEEGRLFESVAPRVHLRSLTEWAAGGSV
jgi:hypothetical protein